MLGNKSHFIHAGNLKCIYAFFYKHEGNLTFDKRESLSVVVLLNFRLHYPQRTVNGCKENVRRKMDFYFFTPI